MCQRNNSIEFIVRPREDLHLEGELRRLLRVSKGEQYSCMMQRNQNFGCLFKHYAKHNGLRKEDLSFFFLEELKAEDSPESVSLMPYDEIWVEHKHSDKISKTHEYHKTDFEPFRSILFSREHSDLIFIIGPEKEEILAHKVILSARSEYFRAMFRRGGMSESKEGRVEIMHHSLSTFKQMLEFIYTESIIELSSCNAEDSLSLLSIANEYLLDNLKSICERHIATILSCENVGRIIISCGTYNTMELQEACRLFILQNINTLKQNEDFRKDVLESPELALLLIDNINENIPSAKRQKLTEGNSHNIISSPILF